VSRTGIEPTHQRTRTLPLLEIGSGESRSVFSDAWAPLSDRDEAGTPLGTRQAVPNSSPNSRRWATLRGTWNTSDRISASGLSRRCFHRPVLHERRWIRSAWKRSWRARGS